MNEITKDEKCMSEDTASSQPIRILHVLGRLNRGGAESRIMDLYRHIDRTKVQFDFLVHYKMNAADAAETASGQNGTKGKTDTQTLYALRPKEDLDDEILSLGGRIYVLPRFTGTNLGSYRRACRTFFAQHHEFTAVEGHMTSMASIYLPIAKAEGVPVTIAHARSAGVDAGIRGVMTRVFRLSLAKRCDVMMSCSKEASISVFGKRAYESGKVMSVPNALELSAFTYDPAKRQKVRTRYGIPENALVIGHVGRLDPVKNHAYIARIGKELVRMRPEQNVYYLFAGKGSLQDEIPKVFKEAGLLDRLILTGQLNREETAGIYQAFDVFVFPSLYEGMPGTVVEAQAAGLPCVIADTITKEAAITDLVVQLPLGEENAGAWAKEILQRTQNTESAAAKREASRSKASADAMKELETAGYEVTAAAAKMQEFYLQCSQNR